MSILSLDRVSYRQRWSDDCGLEDLARSINGCELELLLGAEVGIEPALAHADVLGEFADR
jgi:hypothetical protein